MEARQRRDRLTNSNTWHGTRQEASELVEAIQHNCACRYNDSGARLRLCPAHRMLVEDQRALDGLVFARRISSSLQLEEWLDVPPTWH